MDSTGRKGTSPKADGGKTKTRTRTRSKSKIDRAALIDKLLCSIEERIVNQELKGTVNDFIRLLQLQKELEDEQPREIEVRWVEPTEPDDASGE